jgi:hypothetical protein|tara:strand:+ start:2227 stop:2376 length:150 start_codon:yes stop_codon:yes gene_type:complete
LENANILLQNAPYMHPFFRILQGEAATRPLYLLAFTFGSFLCIFGSNTI